MVATISQPRLSAFHALTSVEAGRSDLPTALARSRATLHDERDRALTAEIVTGTLRWRGQLDALVAHFSRRPVARLDPEILTILRLSVYQILHLARVPAAAATNDAVALARHARKASAAAFVNAVLRSIVRERSSLPLPERPSADGTRAHSNGSRGASVGTRISDRHVVASGLAGRPLARPTGIRRHGSMGMLQQCRGSIDAPRQHPQDDDRRAGTTTPRLRRRNDTHDLRTRWPGCDRRQPAANAARRYRRLYGTR